MTGTEHTTRVFQAGSFTFIVESNQRRLCETVELLFADLLSGGAPMARFTLTDGPNGTRLGGADLVPFTYRRDTSAILDELVTAVNRMMLDAGGDRLHLHAGAVSKGDRTVLVSAASGTGKTTLVNTLTRRGWTYLTDEAVSLAQADRHVRSFPKPLSIKPGGHNLFPDLADHRVSLGGTESGLWQVPVGALGIATATAADPTMIVVLSRATAESKASWEPMSPADTVVELIEQSLDFERYGKDALLSVAELCARCHCVHVESGTPDDTADLVEDLAFELVTEPHAVRVLVVAPSALVDADVVSVTIGATAVVLNRRTGRCVSLNPEGTQIWSALCLGDPWPQGDSDARFAEELQRGGFLQVPDSR